MTPQPLAVTTMASAPRSTCGHQASMLRRASARASSCSDRWYDNAPQQRPPSTAIAGISAIAGEGGRCCGALSYHLSEHDEARALARRNIDAWWPHVERGAEAIVVTASGCGVMVRDYGDVF